MAELLAPSYDVELVEHSAAKAAWPDGHHVSPVRVSVSPHQAGGSSPKTPLDGARGGKSSRMSTVRSLGLLHDLQVWCTRGGSSSSIGHHEAFCASTDPRPSQGWGGSLV